MASQADTAARCPFEPTVLRYERDTIPVVSKDIFPSLIDDDSLVERLDALRARFPYLIFDGDPTIHFLRWNEASEIFRNWAEFSSTKKHTLENFRPSGEVALIPAGYDPPQAFLYKKFLQPKYSEASGSDFEPSVRAHAARLIEGFRTSGQCDYMEDFSARYFGPILLRYVGIPEEDVDMVQELEQDTFRVPERDPGGKIQAHAAKTLSNYLEDLTKKARAALPPEGERADDLITYMLTQPMANGELMSDAEIKAALHLMCLGGAHSVKRALGYAMKLFADNPELRHNLLDSDGNVSAAKVEEILRWKGAGGGMTYRRVTKDTELGGCPLQEGDTVATVMTAANHDPGAEEDAETFRLDRERVKSFTFAFGTHRCLGIHFARMGTKVAMEEWHRRIPDYKVAENSHIVEQTWAGVGYLELPLVWDPATTKAG